MRAQVPLDKGVPLDCTFAAPGRNCQYTKTEYSPSLASPVTKAHVYTEGGGMEIVMLTAVGAFRPPLVLQAVSPFGYSCPNFGSLGSL